ncbi:MAG: ACT domain-containing protein [Christensenellales bacterium]|jgi:chorismate mutase
MLKGYLIVDKDALPDFFLKVVAARKLIESGACSQVSEAVKQAGISRSTYYKYKDRILEPAQLTVGRKAVLSMLLTHEPGALSKVLGTISTYGASVLTITQSLPISGKASVTVSLDLQNMTKSIDALVMELMRQREAENVRLIAVE